jgi:hypothetical protein
MVYQRGSTTAPLVFLRPNLYKPIRTTGGTFTA